MQKVVGGIRKSSFTAIFAPLQRVKKFSLLRVLHVNNQLCSVRRSSKLSLQGKEASRSEYSSVFCQVSYPLCLFLLLAAIKKKYQAW